MLRALVSTARRQRLVALLGVVAFSLTVPPAFGAPSMASQLKRALKLATRADKNATTALNLAKATTPTGTSQSAVKGERGEKGSKGDAGAPGAAGAAGPKGDTGAAGATGAKGDTGAAGATGPKGDTGATGPQGPVGPAGPAAPGGGASHAIGTRASSAQTVPVGQVPLSDPAAGTNVGSISLGADSAHVVTAHLSLDGSTHGSASEVSCLLVVGTDVIDAATTTLPYGGFHGDATLTGLVPASSSDASATVSCTATASVKARPSLTAISVITP